MCEWKTVSEVWIKWAQKLISTVSERRKTNDYFTFYFLGDIFSSFRSFLLVVGGCCCCCLCSLDLYTRECNVLALCCTILRLYLVKLENQHGDRATEWMSECEPQMKLISISSLVVAVVIIIIVVLYLPDKSFMAYSNFSLIIVHSHTERSVCLSIVDL